MHNIILLGMPGVGKSTIGRLLATIIDRPYTDTDEYILTKTGRDPAEHFTGLSDTDALKKEIELISDIHQENGIIALSGSVPMSHVGMELIRRWGNIIIQLDAPVSTITKRIQARPDTDSRIIFGDCKTLDELIAYRSVRFQSLRTHNISCDREPLFILSDIIRIISGTHTSELQSTRTSEISDSFRHAIFEARPTSGLWYRDIIQYSISSEQRNNWMKIANHEPLTAFESLWNFLDTGFSGTQISQAVKRLSKFRHADILPFRPYRENTSFLDLTQGPTCAFKDFALQVLTSFVAQDIEEHNKRVTRDSNLPKRFMIAQTSTSGDTGPAGGAGVQGQPAICNIIGYPEHEASYVQKQQMHELRGNVFSLGFEESFSSIQKSMLAQNTPNFQKKLHDICAEANPGKSVKIHAGSFNSINPGRIDAQMIYHTIAQFRAEGSLLQAGQKLATVVPSGNGGHVFGALTARLLSGVPGPTIISCNANDFFEKLINHGILEMPESDSAVHQPSVSMIIEYPNNMERLFRLAFGPERTSEIMSDFSSGKTVQLTTDEQSMLRFGLNLHAVRVTGTEELITMREYFRETGKLICPHTANALCAWEKIESKFTSTHALICETASTWKFLASTAAALSEAENIWQEYESLRPLESSYEGVQKLLQKIEAGFQSHGKAFTIPDYIKPWLGPEINHTPPLSCRDFGEKTLEIVREWIREEK